MEDISSFFLKEIKLDDINHSKKTIEILKKLTKIRNKSNIILNGKDGTGKKMIIKSYLNKYYNGFKLNLYEFDYKYNSRNYTFPYYKNNNIFLLDMRFINNYPNCIIDFIEEYTKTKSFIDIERTIIILHSELIDKKLMYSLRSKIEKINKKETYVIFSTNTLTNFIEPIKSRCLLLRVTQIQLKDFTKILKFYNLKLTQYYKKKIYENYKPNIKNMIINTINYIEFKEKNNDDNIEKYTESFYLLLKKK